MEKDVEAFVKSLNYKLRYSQKLLKLTNVN